MKSTKWSNYHRLYDTYFKKSGVLLEIGIDKGGSLVHWKNKGHTVYGIDILDCPRIDGIEQLKGNVCNPFFMDKVFKYLPPLNYIIDDGGHRPYQQWLAFKWLWPLLINNGVYCIEDLHLAQKPHWRLWEKLGLPGVESIKRKLWNEMHGPWAGSSETEYLVRHNEIHVYPHIMFIRKNISKIISQTKEIIQN